MVRGWNSVFFFVLRSPGTDGVRWWEDREAKNVFVHGNSTDDGMLVSDHRLVVADVVLH